MRRTRPTILLLLGAAALGACSERADPLSPRPAPSTTSTPRTPPPRIPATVGDIDDALTRLVPALGSGAETGHLQAALQQLRVAALAGDTAGTHRHARDAEQRVAALAASLGSQAAADLGAIALLLDTRR